MKTKKKMNWSKVVGFVIIYLAFISLGFSIGLVYQQVLFYNGLGKALSYTDIQVNFNETKFIQEMNDTFIPAWKEAFNQTIREQVIIQVEQGEQIVFCYNSYFDGDELKFEMFECGGEK